MALELRTTTAFERDLRRVNKQGKDLDGNCSPPSRPTDALEPSAGAHVEYLREMCMRSIALKLPEELLEESGRLAERMRISRAEYIRVAIRRMNRKTAARLRAERLAEVSKRVRAESMRVNAEFAAIERDRGA
jgi:Arc/MetJ-type ribon-helix-helix transcriptional regulator